MTPILSRCDRRQARPSTTMPRRLSRSSPMCRRPKVLILNKIDLVAKPKLLGARRTAQRARCRSRRRSWSRRRTATGRRAEALARRPCAGRALALSRGPDFGRADARAGGRDHAGNLPRLHQELPYRSTVETEAGRNCKDGAVRIEQTIFRRAREPAQDRARQGRPGHQAIGAEAREEIAAADRKAGASVPVRQGPGGWARRSGTLSRNGPGVPDGIDGHRRAQVM